MAVEDSANEKEPVIDLILSDKRDDLLTVFVNDSLKVLLVEISFVWVCKNPP